MLSEYLLVLLNCWLCYKKLRNDIQHVKKLAAWWPLSSPRQIPWLFPVFPTETLMFIKPPEIYRQTYVYSWVNTDVALSAVHPVHVNFT